MIIIDHKCIFYNYDAFHLRLRHHGQADRPQAWANWTKNFPMNSSNNKNQKVNPGLISKSFQNVISTVSTCKETCHQCLYIFFCHFAMDLCISTDIVFGVTPRWVSRCELLLLVLGGICHRIQLLAHGEGVFQPRCDSCFHAVDALKHMHWI